MSQLNEYVGKTAKGLDEVKNRSIKLPPKVRTMLILIDAQRPLGELVAQAAQLGAPDDWLELLEREGLVHGQTAANDAHGAMPEVQRDEFSLFRETKHFMNVSLVNALGIRAFFFTLKLERCATRADLRALYDEYVAAINKSKGNAEALVLGERLGQMLAVPAA